MVLNIFQGSTSIASKIVSVGLIPVEYKQKEIEQQSMEEMDLHKYTYHPSN